MALSEAVIDGFRKDFFGQEKNVLAQNMVSRSDPMEACLQRRTIETFNHVFSHKVDEVKPVTSQKSSGRCWLFACLNAMRVPFMKAMNIEEFEFSQNHLFFWDKVERSNYFLNAIAQVHRRTPCERVGGRLVSFLLANPISDGGQWDMVVNLVQKHGVMPKKCFPESWSSESSTRMNGILKSKLREFAHDIHCRMDAGASDADVQDLIRDQMKVIFRIVSICLGTPPKEFSWEYYDKSKKCKKVGPISSLAFYEELVKPHFDLASKVCLISDPRPQNPTSKTYTVDCLGNVVGGRPTVYNNQPIEVLAEIAADSIAAGEAVWFGCDIGKHTISKQGLLDLKGLDYPLVFGAKVNLNLPKAERLIYGDSEMSHAMVLTGVHFDKDQENVVVGVNGGQPAADDAEDAVSNSLPTKWRVENSWGEDRHEKGYLTMTTDWFKEFVFEVVVDKKFCSDEILRVFEMEPQVLPAWDPMGALAKSD